MPLPTPKKNEDKNSFVSRCVSDLSDKNEGKDSKQRVAICMSQWTKSKANLTDKEIEELDKLIDKI